ncbi:uncharacterized protein METZ01_LOCUS389513 [marine metagenome]|uniref:Uncharacterized protein n=1 Tax=marine metagenome TaxID=408172 RepID=A0A382UQX9_9ZZZZ
MDKKGGIMNFNKGGIKMRAILILVIATMLVFTLGCNYEYGNYGKEKSESGTETPTSEN